MMEHSWVVIAWVGPDLEERLLKSNLATISRNPGFLKPLGITSDRAYRPWVVKPSIEVWQEIVSRINRSGLGCADGKSSQLSLRADGDAETRHYNFTVRHYRPGTLCLEVTLKEPLGSSVADYFRNRNLENHPLACTAVDWLIGMLVSGQNRDYPTNNSYSARAAMMLPVDVDEKYFGEWRKNHQEELVGLLINNIHFNQSDGDLSERVMSNNKELNLKYAKSGFSLVSKQGVITAYPSDTSDLSRDLRRVHQLRYRFLEYALALQKFLEKYQDVRTKDSERATFLLFLALPFLSEDANFPHTVTGSKTWKVLAEEFSLKRSLDALEEVQIDDVQSREKYYLKLAPSQYDSFDYAKKVRKITAPARNWLLRDFSDKKIFTFVVGTVLTSVALVFTYIKLFQ